MSYLVIWSCESGAAGERAGPRAGQVSRDFIAGHDDVSTVICAPVYGEVLGLRTEIVVGEEDGLPRQSAIRCDFLTLMFKKKLSGFVATLSPQKQIALKQALGHALQIHH